MATADDDRYFEHDADIGVIGRGVTLEGCLEAAAAAVFAIMTDAPGAEADQPIDVAFDEDDPEFALVAWINLLLGAAREHGLALHRFALARSGAHWHGRAWGRPWTDADERGTEVKGATLTMLSVRERADGWEARCIVDV